MLLPCYFYPMPLPRHFLFPDSQAGVFHVVSRVAGRAYSLEQDEGREELVKMMQSILPRKLLKSCCSPIPSSSRRKVSAVTQSAPPVVTSKCTTLLGQN